MPFYAYSVSLGDVVLAPIDPAEQQPTFTAVMEKCGNRTVRIFFDEPVANGSKSLVLLEGLSTWDASTKVRPVGTSP